MKTIISEQQAAFFTKNGYIEFEIQSPPIPSQEERDLWRKDPKIQSFLLRKLAPIACALTRKNQLRLGCDHYFPLESIPKKSAPIKECVSIQGLAIGVLLAENPVPLKRRTPLGIIPLPSTSNQVLFFRPDLILDWPHAGSSVYFALFTLPNAVYVHNPQDPYTHKLKDFGYHFGDTLSKHPLIIQ